MTSLKKKLLNEQLSMLDRGLKEFLVFYEDPIKPPCTLFVNCEKWKEWFTREMAEKVTRLSGELLDFFERR